MRKFKFLFLMTIVLVVFLIVLPLSVPTYATTPTSYQVTASEGTPPPAVLGIYTENGTFNGKPRYQGPNNYWIYYGSWGGDGYWHIGYNNFDSDLNSPYNHYYLYSGSATPPTNVSYFPGQVPGNTSKVKLQIALFPEMRVIGNNIEIADGDNNASVTDHTDFGTLTMLSGSLSRTFTINNTGNSALSLTGTPIVSIGGATNDFIINQPASTTVASNGQITFNVTFSPKSLGLRTAVISIANNDSNENPYNFTIQGTAINGDAGLASVAEQTDATPTGTGADAPNPIAWSVDVANSVSSIGLSDIIVATNATKNLYSNAEFTTEVTGENTISLNSGVAKTVYIKVTAEDTTVKYYAVTLTRELPIPSVTLSIDNSSISESGGGTTITATLSSVSVLPVTVNLAYSGTATGSGTDYTASADSITIAAGNLTGTTTVTAVADLLDEDDETVIADISSVTNGIESGSQQVTTTITDDDAPPTVTLSVSGSPFAENAGVATITASLSEVSSKNVIVIFAFSGTATGGGTDYTALADSITIAAGDLTGTCTLIAAADTLDEDNETVICDITGVANGIESGSQQVTATIVDDDAQPTISISDISVTEADSGTVSLVFNVNLSAVSGRMVFVDYVTADGTASTADLDYTVASGTLTFAAGTTAQTITVTANGDTKYETDENFFVNLSNSVNAIISDAQGIGTITNNDVMPTVVLSIDNSSIPESGGAAIATATLSNASYQNVTINLSYSGTATGVGTDYTALADSIMIAAGDLTGTTTVTAVADLLDEENETVIVDITSVTNGTESGTQQVTATIADDDAPPTISISDISVTEADSGTVSLVFNVNLSAVSGRKILVDYATADGTASTADLDYTVASGTLTFAAGITSQTITVTANGDTKYETDETILVNLCNPSKVIISDAQGIGTITNDDLMPTVALSIDNSSISESGGAAIATATLSNASYQNVTVNLAYSGTATGGGTDYTALADSITIAAGDLTGTTTVTAVSDLLDEANETVIANISSVTNGTESGSQQVTTIITDDDAPPTISISDISVTEADLGTVSLVFNVNLSAVSGRVVTVNYATADGTASTADLDYTAASGTLIFAAGTTSQLITVTANGDTKYETDETILVNLNNSVNAIISDAQGIGTITNDDLMPIVALSIDNSSISESGGAAIVTATLSNASYQNVTINLAYSGTATGGGSDYTASAASIIIAAGSLTGTASISVDADTMDEVDETVIVDITSVTNGMESGTQLVTTTITDDDAPPTVTLSVSGSPFAENAGVATVTASLSEVSSKTVTVNLDYNGTATGGTDYTALADSITIAAGNLTGTVTITAVSDLLYETNETVIVDITSVVNGTENGLQQVTATIADDDAPPTISISDISVTEADSGTVSLVFNVNLSAVSGRVITVDYAMVDGTASTADLDYTAVSGTLTFAAGTISKTITVTANGDTKYETDETILVNLNNSVNAIISDAQGIGTITNDDLMPIVALSIDNSSISESGGAAIVTATLSNISYQNVTVNLAFSGTATGGGTDYTASADSITIAAGSLTGTATVTADSDLLDEFDETVIVDISSVINGAELGSQQVTTTITDDDEPSTISINDTSVIEGNTGTTNLLFTITLSAPSAKTITVDYATANGTAETTTPDYMAALGTLTFNPGQTSTTVTVSVMGDGQPELDETVLMNLSASVNASITDAQGTGTIVDDDVRHRDKKGAEVIIDGQSSLRGTLNNSTNSSGQTVMTLTVNSYKLNNALNDLDEGESATIILPLSNGSDVARGVLTGDIVDNMEQSGSTLVIETDRASYELPAEEIDINAISSQFRQNVSLADIIVTVSIAEPSDEMVTVVENAAEEGGYSLVVPAVEFSITCSYANQTIEVNSFNSYVERLIAIPNEVDPHEITTAVIVDPDGTERHVPTRIVEIDGQYYAIINSVTNSIYSVVYNAVAFADVTTHWAKDAINDMGSRMIIAGKGNNCYYPSREITRAEFAAIIVRALGLEPKEGASNFSDISSTAWYCQYIGAAAEYGIISGYKDGTFGPNNKITREQAMTMIARAMKITGLEAELTKSSISQLLAVYSDGNNASEYAKESIAACLKTEIVAGKSGNTIKPKDYINRAEVAVIIQRLLQKSELI